MKREPTKSWEDIISDLDRIIDERMETIRLISEIRDMPHLSEFAQDMLGELEKYSTMLTLVKFQAHPETWDPKQGAVLLTLAQKHNIDIPDWMLSPSD